MTYEEAVAEIAKSLGLSVTLVDRIYKAYWKAIREHISSLPLKEDLTDEEFLSYKANVNVPSLGKFHVTLDEYKKAKSIYRKYKEYKLKQESQYVENKES